MKTLPRPAAARPRESTIGLVNIVFLMLVFFLVAGALTPPFDDQVELIESQAEEPVPPPDALSARVDGTLWYQGETVSVEAYMDALESNDVGKITARLVADQNLPARQLIGIAQELRDKGATSVILITERVPR